MEIKITVNDADTLKQINGLSVEAHMEAWAEAVLQLAQKRARERLGGGFGKRIADSVQARTSGLKSDISTSGPEGYIGEAVQQGGTFRARSGKLLAIPIHPWMKKGGQYAGLFPRVFQEKAHIPLFLIKSKKGNRLLFQKPEKGQKLEAPFFVLKETTRHKPRPWWPEKTEVEIATNEYFEDNF